MKEMLNVIAEQMQLLNINYDFMSWKITPIPYPYTVGKYFISSYERESGMTSGEFVLTAWDRSQSYSNLIELEQKIKNHFKDFRAISNGTGMNLNFYYSSPVEDDTDDFKKIELRLDFSCWEGE